MMKLRPESLNDLTKFTQLLNGKAETALWGEGHSPPLQDLYQRADQLTSCVGNVIKSKLYNDIPDIPPYLGASQQ